MFEPSADLLVVSLVVFCLPVIRALEEQAVTINKPLQMDSTADGTTRNWMQNKQDYVRCYCNLPACVTTGYMCKSRTGGCFSDLMDHRREARRKQDQTAYRARHGCVELLTDRDQRLACQNSDESQPKHPRALLICCKHDMCNHVENPQTKDILNSTLFGQILEDSADNNKPISSRKHDPLLYSNSEVWFRAATIAVPICGAVILFVLIALAVKILRSENENSPGHKLGPALYIHHLGGNKGDKYLDRHFENLLQKPCNQHHQNFLLVGNQEPARQILLPAEMYCPGGTKNEANAKLNLMQNETVCDYLEKDSGCCADVNIVQKAGEKFADM